MEEEVWSKAAENGETSQGVQEKIEAASGSLFEKLLGSAFFMAEVFPGWEEKDAMDVAGPDASLVQQYSLERDLQYSRF